MEVGTPQVRRGVTKWVLVITALVGGLAYITGYTGFAYGLFFGAVFTIVNYRVISVILEVTLRESLPDIARIITFASYHVRFWLIVLILYIIIPKVSNSFVLGTIVGIIIPKVIMGVFIVIHSEEDELWKKKINQAVPSEEPVTDKVSGEAEPRLPELEMTKRVNNEGF